MPKRAPPGRRSRAAADLQRQLLGGNASEDTHRIPENQPESPAAWYVPPVTPAERRKLLAVGVTAGGIDFINKLPPYQRAWWRYSLPGALRAHRRTRHIAEVCVEVLERRAQGGDGR
jgi:hypothetical protein